MQPFESSGNWEGEAPLPAGIRIREASPDDVPELAAFLAALFSQERDFRSDREKQSRGLRLILDQPHVGRILVILREGVVAGMVNLLFTVSTAEGGPAIVLEDMFIRRDLRGQGLGSLLLRHAINFARREGFLRITLLTDAGPNPAREFYLRHGFAPSEMVPLRLHLGAPPANG